MATRLYSNNAASTLASSITAGATSLTVAAGDGVKYPNPTGSDWFVATLQNGTTVEVVKVTARSGDTFTITRAQEGTSSAAFPAGSRVELRATAASFTPTGALGSYTAGDLLVASNTTSLTSLTVGTAGTILQSTGTLPAYRTSLQLVEISNPSTPGANNLLVYAKAVAGASVPTSVLAQIDDGGNVLAPGNLVVLATSLSETTTATGGAVDLVTLTPSVAIQTNWAWGVSALHRKTAGAAAATQLGVKVNGTQVFANTAATSATNQAEDGVFLVPQAISGTQATNYLHGLDIGLSRAWVSATGVQTINNAIPTANYTNPMPNAAITSVTITGNSGSALVTLGIIHVVLWARIPYTV